MISGSRMMSGVGYRAADDDMLVLPADFTQPGNSRRIDHCFNRRFESLLDFQQQISATANDLRTAIVTAEKRNSFFNRSRCVVIVPAGLDHMP